MQGRGERLVAVQQLPQGDEEKNAEESGAAQSAGDAGFRQGFQVVVVRVIDDFPVVVGFVGGKNGLQGTQAGAGPGMVEENAPGVPPHGGTLAGGHFERLKRREAIENLLHSKPMKREDVKVSKRKPEKLIPPQK